MNTLKTNANGERGKLLSTKKKRKNFIKKTGRLPLGFVISNIFTVIVKQKINIDLPPKLYWKDSWAGKLSVRKECKILNRRSLP